MTHVGDQVAQHLEQVLFFALERQVLGLGCQLETDRALGVQIALAGVAQARFGQAGLRFQVVPVQGLDARAEGSEAIGVFGDEGVVQQRRATCGALLGVAFQHVLDHAGDGGQVAADTKLVVLGGDPLRAVVQHFQRVLRVGEALQPAFAQRIEGEHARAALHRAAQFAEHARMVGAGILAEHQDQVGLFEIVQGHRALADADLLAQRHARGFVAHVRTVREIVGAELAHEQLVQERGLVAGATGGVEDRLVRRGQRIELRCDEGEGLVPRHRLVTVGGRVVAHRVGEPALVFQPVVAVAGEFFHAVFREELRADPARSRFERHRLRAVLAELESRGVLAVRPGAAGAVEAIGLVRMQQGLRAKHRDVLVQQVGGHRFQRAPAAGRALVRFEHAFFFLRRVAHVRDSSRSACA